MGQNSTRSRQLPRLYPAMERVSYYGGAYDGTISGYGGADAQIVPRQETTSYRTSPKPRFAEYADVTAEEVRDFVDVTRNGFTEPNPRYDNGHEFFTAKSSLHTSHPYWTFTWRDPRNPDFTYKQHGPLFFQVPSTVQYGGGGVPWADFSTLKLSKLESNKLGADFIARTLPTRGPVQLSAILGELREGLPKMPGLAMLQASKGFGSASASEFLNYTFGVAPSIDDIKDLMKSVAHTSKMVQQYHRDSGRNVRRRLSNEPTETVDVTQDVPIPNLNLPRLWGWDNGAISSVTQLNLTKTTTVRTWFSGCYTYHLADSDSWVDKFKLFEEDANRVLGVRLSWDVLWQLSPWSWLLDWVGSIGDVITNATYLGSDGLVLRYGYLMKHTRVEYKYSMPSGATFTGGAKTGPISNTLVLETKERVRATPYGFGLDLGKLSPKQWAILGALGLSRGPTTLF